MKIEDKLTIKKSISNNKDRIVLENLNDLKKDNNVILQIHLHDLISFSLI